jgi:D-alanyl-D-alanine carboxypeptidase/D-alanyl-D-alanine-endopeptidase (penicillin-binding protein 4)
VTCALLATVLDRGGPGNDIVAGLAIAGQTGTMAAHFQTGTLAGRLRGKTGTLTGVRSLSGALGGPDGHVITFSLVSNGDSAEAAAAQWDQLGKALASYPSNPDVSPYEPLPAHPG